MIPDLILLLITLLLFIAAIALGRYLTDEYEKPNDVRDEDNEDGHYY